MNKSVVFTLIVVALFAAVNTKPNPGRADRFGLTYHGRRWVDVFDYGDSYEDEYDDNRRMYKRPLYCNNCTIHYNGNGKDNKNEIHYHQKKRSILST